MHCFGVHCNISLKVKEIKMNNTISIYDPFRFIDELWSKNLLAANNSTFPPFNIRETDENTRVLELATAGFSREDLNIEINNRQVTISGEKTSTEENKTDKYLHKGIATRKFSKTITLWEFWEVETAEYKDGILSITMKRKIPDSAKPKKLDIN